MADVKVLIIGTSRGNWQKGKKGDFWEVVPSASDWGNATTAPDWLRLTVTGVPGTQQEAEDTMRQYLAKWGNAFIYSEVAGASGGEQRYRVEVVPELDTIPVPIFNSVRNGVTARFATTGTHVNQSNRRWFEFDAFPGLPLDEIEFEVEQVGGGARRYGVSDNFVDNVMGSVASGQPATTSRTHTQFLADIQDKLA